MEEIRSWWEVPCVAHYCHIFQKAFKLPKIEIEELEDALLLDCSPSPSSLLVELFCVFLNGIVDREITTENWEFFLKLHFEWRCQHLSQKWNPFSEGKTYKDLTIRTKVEMLHQLCHWRLELDDIADLLRGVDGPSLRLYPLGKDQEGNTYWHFYGMRLYKEEPKKRKKKEQLNETTTPKKGRGRSTPGKSGRGRGTSRRGKGRGNHDNENPVQSDDEEVTNEVLTRDSLDCSVPATGWSVLFDDLDQWNEFTESFAGIRLRDIKTLYGNLMELLPHIEYLSQIREKDKKRQLLSELPRRTSDRIAIKSAEKDEVDKLLALERELEREEIRKIEAEEQRLADEEADKKRQQKRDEALQRRKAREEQQAKQREAEDENWEKAMSGELTGRRKAALGATINDVSALGDTLLADERNELFTAMFKILSGMRNQDDSWVFEDPVTEAIAPGYFEIIDEPMDYSTVEKKIEARQYKDKHEFLKDLQLIYNNCMEYNGDDSEYTELANEMLNVLDNLQKLHFEGEVLDGPEEEDVGDGKRKKRGKSHSPSPDLTSESSSEEESDDTDESYEDGSRPAKKRKMMRESSSKNVLKLPPGFDDKLGALRPPVGRPFPPNPHLYHQLMQQRMPHMYPSHEFPPRLPPPYPGQPPMRPPHYSRPHHPADMRMPYPGMFPDVRPMFPPHHPMAQQHAAAYHQMMLQRSFAHRQQPNLHPQQSSSPGLTQGPRPQANSPGLTQGPRAQANSPGLTQGPRPQANSPGPTQGPRPQANSPGLTQGTHPQASSPGLTQGPRPQANSPGLTQGTHPQANSPGPTQGPRPQASSPGLTQGTHPQASSPGLTQGPHPQTQDSALVRERSSDGSQSSAVAQPSKEKTQQTDVALSCDGGRGSQHSPMRSNSTSSVDNPLSSLNRGHHSQPHPSQPHPSRPHPSRPHPSQPHPSQENPIPSDIRQHYQAEHYERYRRHMMAMQQQQQRPQPFPDGGFPPPERFPDEYYAWKGYPQEMDYMQHQARYWHEIEMRQRQAYENMMRHRAEQKQGMTSPGDLNPSTNGEKGEGRPQYPPMNGYVDQMDYPPNGHPHYPHRPPFFYPYQRPPSAPNVQGHMDRPPNVQGHMDRPPNVQGHMERPPNVQGHMERPPNVQGHMGRPPNVQGHMDRPPNVQGHMDWPPNVQGHMERLTNVQGHVEKPPNVQGHVDTPSEISPPQNGPDKCQEVKETS